MRNKMLVLENGKVYYGEGFGNDKTQVGELVFNTAMVGYQEILSNPSYCGQMVVMSYPLIGNYGLNDEDFESKNISIGGFIVREYNDKPSNFRYTRTLSDFMDDSGVAGISGVNTREIVQIIRDEGSMRAIITDATYSVEECLEMLQKFSLPTNLVRLVSSKKVWYSRTRNPIYTVCAIDCGTVLGMVKKLNELGCNVVVVPYNTSAYTIEQFKSDGLLISSGPGDPKECNEVVELIKHFRGKLPILGVGLGHQLVALAYGAETYKMKLGHHGANYAVQNTVNGKVDITTQNHSYAIVTDSLQNSELSITHINLIDGEIEGMADTKNKLLSAQFTDCDSSGNSYLLNTFLQFLEEGAGGQNNAKKNRY